MDSLTAALTLLLVVVHLLAMNLAAGGPLAAAWLAARTTEHSAERLQWGRRILLDSLGALALGAVTGGWLWYVGGARLQAAIVRFAPRDYWFAGAELVFSAACVAGARVVASRGSRGRKWFVLLCVVAATNLLYHFPPLMLVLGRLTRQPDWIAEALIPRRTFVKFAVTAEIAPTWAHFALASLVVASTAGMRRIALTGGDEGDGNRSAAKSPAVRSLALLGLIAAGMQFPAGVWLAAVASDGVRAALFGDNLGATTALLAGLFAAVQVVRTLLGVVLGDGDQNAWRRTAAWTLLTALAMTASLRMARQ